MSNNKTDPYIVSDGIGSRACKEVNPTTAYTVLSDDNYVICGADSVAVTLAATSNSPVTISSIDGTTQRASCTIVANGATYTIGTNGSTAYCFRRGSASANKWAIIGAITAS